MIENCSSFFILASTSCSTKMARDNANNETDKMVVGGKRC
jgi:hypothetical protein